MLKYHVKTSYYAQDVKLYIQSSYYYTQNRLHCLAYHEYEVEVRGELLSNVIIRKKWESYSIIVIKSGHT